ncbi:MAG: arginine deiminase family protein [Thermodesulfobacteriota bacterium]
MLSRHSVRKIRPIDYFKEIRFVVIEATRDKSCLVEACNFVCLGQVKLAAYNMTERINNMLRDKGLEIIGIAGDQLVKANGGPRCMTRPVYGNN